MTITRRLLPPAAGPMQTMTVNGRSYSSTPGNFLDVPDFDAQVLEANGWIFVAGAVRPRADQVRR